MQTIETLKKITKEALINVHLEDLAEIIFEQGISAINIKTSPTSVEITQHNKSNNTGLTSILNMFKPKTPVQKEPMVDPLPVGTSKIGGHPDVPDGFNWPYHKEQPLSLLAQLNLSDIKRYDLNNLFPETGMLYFFYDSEEMPWGDQKEDKAGWKVIYTEDTKNLKRTNHPDYKNNDYYFKPCKLTFENFLSLPDFESFNTKLNIEIDEEQEEQYAEYTFDPLNQSYYHLLLGYPMVIQNNDMEDYCEKNTNTIIASNNEDDKEQLKKNLQEWILLLQIDTDTKAGMMWGDCGRLYFWIKKEDLKNKNFDNVWMILQCY